MAGLILWAALPIACPPLFLNGKAQNTYWFLVLRKDIGARKGQIDAVKGLTIGAAPLVELGLRRLLHDAQIDLVRDKVTICPVPAQFLGETKNFGVAASKAPEAGAIDGFWANVMGAEAAVRRVVGDIIIDARHGDGPAGARHYTMSSLIITDKLIANQPDVAAATVRAIVNTQKALCADV